MIVEETKLKDCLIIKPSVFSDDRGFFLETFNRKRYSEIAGIDHDFLQENHSRSIKGVLRGLHFQKTKPQGKLVRVVKGLVFDVAVDLRKNSPSYGNWLSLELSEDNKNQLWIPPGFAHGFQVLSDTADFEYMCTDYYDPDDEGSLAWNDEHLKINWPIIPPILSSKDKMASSFTNLDL